jgi:hypothetical protein
MKGESGVRSGFVLPLPRFVLHPLTALAIAALHVYLAAGHLAELAADDVEWTHFWKGFGALAGAYVFAALASRSAWQFTIIAKLKQKAAN